MKVLCEHCGKQYNAPENLLGKRIKCKNCGQAFVIAPVEEEPVEEEPVEPQESAYEESPTTRR